MKTRNGAAAIVAVAFACVAGLASAAVVKKGRDVYLITLDPGHFHAALVQKFMLPNVSPDVRVFAPRAKTWTSTCSASPASMRRADNPTHVE
jgi:hypothetical protein